jgi:hypothetical protein
VRGPISAFATDAYHRGYAAGNGDRIENNGYNAGFRGDMMIFDPHPRFVLGHGRGRADRVEYNRGYADARRWNNMVFMPSRSYQNGYSQGMRDR